MYPFDSYPFDLQLFAENSEAVAAEPQSSTETEVADSSSTESPSFDYEGATRDQRIAEVSKYFVDPEPEPPADQQQPPADQQQVPPAQVAEETTDVGIEVPAKFLNPDGTPNIDALVKSYVNAEKKIGEQGNKMGTQNQQIQELMQKIQELESRQTQAQEPVASSEVPPQDSFDMEGWFEKFYENPKEALQELFQGTVNEAISPQLKQLEPVIQYFEQQKERAYWDSKVDEVRQKYSDFDNFREKAAEIIQQQPAEFLNLPNAVEAAYLMAKGEVLDAEKASQPTIEDMLKSPEFLQQLSQNPELQKMVLKSYSEQIGKEPKPTMVGSHPGSASPATPPPEIKSVKDATKAFRAFLSGGS